MTEPHITINGTPTDGLMERLAREAGFNTSAFKSAGCIAAPTARDDALCDCLEEPLRHFAALVAEECASEVQRILSGKHAWSFVSEGQTYATQQEFIAAAVAAAVRQKYTSAPERSGDVTRIPAGSVTGRIVDPE